MNWEQRLREMILAGGAVAATACAGSSAVTSSDASSDVASGGSSSGGSSGGSSSGGFGDADFCCNASSDPCCYLICAPDAEPLGGCLQKMECESDGGVWDYNFSDTCSWPDAAPQDASPDAPQDAPDTIDALAFCCNANPDPCCATLHCGAPMTVTCSQELACQADGGTWSFTSGSCTLAGDARADGE
jgi:hypothetical protein